MKTATVDRDKARYFKIYELGIDFANEIDVWTRMEIKYRKQILLLRNTGTFGEREIAKDADSLRYAFREKVDF